MPKKVIINEDYYDEDYEEAEELDDEELELFK